MATDISTVLSCNKTKGPRILLGCSGSVATIKVSHIAARLEQQLGASVVVLPTKQALHFLQVTAEAVLRTTTSLHQDRTDENSAIKTTHYANTVVDPEQLPTDSKEYHSELAIKYCTPDLTPNAQNLVNSSTSLSVACAANEVKPFYCYKCMQNYNKLKYLSSVSVVASSSNFASKEKDHTKLNTSNSKYLCENSSEIPNTNINNTLNTAPMCENVAVVPLNKHSSGSTTSLCEWCQVGELYPQLVVAGDTLEWEMWRGRGDVVLHIELRRWADLLLIAPLGANTMAKMAYGLCDNLLSSVVRAWDVCKPLLFCPAMNTHMYQHPITQRHRDTLKEFGYTEVPAICKQLMCGDVGAGAMAELDTIVDAVASALQRKDVN